MLNYKYHFPTEDIVMTIIQKILDMLKLSDDKQNSGNHKMEQYYKRESLKKEFNLAITYQDIAEYNMNPFDLKQPLISDGNFICIGLDGYNLNIAYAYLKDINNFIKPFSKYWRNTPLPSQITTDCIFDGKLPISHLRLTPYTATKKKSKYPFYLWLQYYGSYGYEYLYRLYFDQNGEIKKCALLFHGNNTERTSYQIQIRNDGTKNYVRRIDKTIYKEPYGTHIIYMYDE